MAVHTLYMFCTFHACLHFCIFSSWCQCVCTVESCAAICIHFATQVPVLFIYLLTVQGNNTVLYYCNSFRLLLHCFPSHLYFPLNLPDGLCNHIIIIPYIIPQEVLSQFASSQGYICVPCSIHQWLNCDWKPLWDKNAHVTGILYDSTSHYRELRLA